MRTIDTNKQQAPLTNSALNVEPKPLIAKRIKGLVTNIVDGNTFEISIHNTNGYGTAPDKHLEIIRIHGMNKPSTSTLSGILAKLELEKKIVGRTLECEIIEKDELDQLIAIIPNKYLQSPFVLAPDQD